MGADVGQLLFGAKISEKIAQEIFKACGLDEYGRKDDKGGQEVSEGVIVDMPYETDEYYLALNDETNRESQNGGDFIGENIETPSYGRARIEAALKKFNLPVETAKIGWYLIGHYD